MWRPLPSPGRRNHSHRDPFPSTPDSGSDVEELRQGAQAIGSRSADVSSVAIGMENLDISGIEGRPPEPLMTNERVIYTENIEEDLKELEDIGFIIDYPNSKLGSGLYGDVYKGKYGPNVTKNTDMKGQPLRNVRPNMPFAVKMVDFKKIEGQKWTNIGMGGTQLSQDMEPITRDSYETEKHIMTFADHPNITPIRMAVNMGEPKTYTNQSTGIDYIQRQRIYLIMDFAELGPLCSFDTQRLTSIDRIKLTQDLFWGLKYLHDNLLTHGDVHYGNVLLFKEDTGIVAKWADFGLGYVGNKPQISPSSYFTEETFIEKKQSDCIKFYTILRFIWISRKRDDEDEYTQQLSDQFIELQTDLRNLKDLDLILEKFKTILKWEDRLI